MMKSQNDFNINMISILHKYDYNQTFGVSHGITATNFNST